MAGAGASAVDRAALPERLRHNLPDWLAERAAGAQLGDEFWPLVEAIERAAPLDLRVNTLKAKRERRAGRARRRPASTPRPTPYSPLGLRIDGKPALHKLDVFARGDVEVQDEGSQLLALLTGAKRGEMVVDFCAGAGGKTLALGAQMRNTGRLYAFDVSGHRLAALKPRLARSGLSNVHPAQIAHERDERIKRLAGKIDRVLVDAPCSGLGTLRRNPDLKWRQSPRGGRRAARQAERAILAQRGAAGEAGRAAGLRHLQPAARRRTRPSPRPSTPSHAQRLRAAAGARGAASAPRSARAETLVERRLPAPVAASARHRRLLRRGLGAALSLLEPCRHRTSSIWRVIIRRFPRVISRGPSNRIDASVTAE